jgi:hypothetical protein
MAWAMPKYFICLSSVKDQAVLSYFYPHSDWTLLEYSTVAEDQGSNVDVGYFEISVGHLASKTSPGVYTTSPSGKINALNIVSPSY